MEETLTPEEKVQIVESFNNYESWIDDESMGMSIVDDVNYEVAEKHQIPGSADIQSLFWDDEPIASQANAALEQLRELKQLCVMATLKPKKNTITLFKTNKMSLLKIGKVELKALVGTRCRKMQLMHC